MRIRAEAANALGNIKDSRAVESLLAVVKDEDAGWYLRQEASDALGKIGDKSIIHDLLPYLLDWAVSKNVAVALSDLGWKPESIEDKIHFFIASRDKNDLIQTWDTTKTVLLKDVESEESRLIENALYAFIGIGKSEIIPELIEKLNQKGTKIMAEAYLNCGHDELSKAAKDWADKHGYIISTGSGAHPVNWGSM